MDEKMNAMMAQLDENKVHISQLQEELQALNENKEHIAQLQGEVQALREQSNAAASGVRDLKSTCSALISELKEEIEKEEVSVIESGGEISVNLIDRILFDFGSASITPEGREILNRVGKILKESKAARIRIAGHTDSVPIALEYQYLFPSNWELSAARAAAVARYFQNQIGIDPERMQVVGHAFNDPIANNETSEGRAKNRRVEIILTPDVA
jgi:chemotaxis protein MotB